MRGCGPGLKEAAGCSGMFQSRVLLFLVLNRSEKEWTMPAREWCMAKAQFAILFGERFTRALA